MTKEKVTPKDKSSGAVASIISEEIALLKLLFLSSGIPIVLAFAFWILLVNSSVQACAIFDRPGLYWLWPPNLMYYPLLLSSNYSHSEVCLFLAINCVLSTLFMLWLAWRIRHEITRTPHYFEPGFLYISLFIFVLSVLSASVNFKVYSSHFNFSLAAPMSLNIVKSFILITGFYLSLGAILAKGVRYFRFQQYVNRI